MPRALRKAGVDAEHHIYDDQSHGDYMSNVSGKVPEYEDAPLELLEFFDKHFK